jgi:hypothetical protein
MAGKPSRYKSIGEVRSSFYPGSAGMLDLGREEVVDLPSRLAGKSRKIMEDIAKRAAEEDAVNLDESPADER